MWFPGYTVSHVERLKQLYHHYHYNLRGCFCPFNISNLFFSFQQNYLALEGRFQRTPTSVAFIAFQIWKALHYHEDKVPTEMRESQREVEALLKLRTKARDWFRKPGRHRHPSLTALSDCYNMQVVTTSEQAGKYTNTEGWFCLQIVWFLQFFTKRSEKIQKTNLAEPESSEEEKERYMVQT